MLCGCHSAAGYYGEKSLRPMFNFSPNMLFNFRILFSSSNNSADISLFSTLCEHCSPYDIAVRKKGREREAGHFLNRPWNSVTMVVRAKMKRGNTRKREEKNQSNCNWKMIHERLDFHNIFEIKELIERTLQNKSILDKESFERAAWELDDCWECKCYCWLEKIQLVFLKAICHAKFANATVVTIPASAKQMKIEF